MDTTDPTPAERVSAVKMLNGSPSELREAAMELLTQLGNERKSALTKQKKINQDIGKAAHTAAEIGLSYEQQAVQTGIDRNSIYRSAGTVELGSRDPKPGELTRLVRKLKDYAPRRVAVNQAITANSEGMAELVRWLHHELNVNLQTISDAGQVFRSTLYGWIRAGEDTTVVPAPRSSKPAGKPKGGKRPAPAAKRSPAKRS